MPQRTVQLSSVDLGDTPCTFSTKPLDRLMDLDYRALEVVVEDDVEILPGQVIERYVEFRCWECCTEHTFDSLRPV